VLTVLLPTLKKDQAWKTSHYSDQVLTIRSDNSMIAKVQVVISIEVYNMVVLDY